MIVYRLKADFGFPGIKFVDFNLFLDVYRDLLCEIKRVSRKWPVPKCRFCSMEDFHDATCRTKKQSQVMFDRGPADYVNGTTDCFSNRAKKVLGPLLRPYGGFLPIDVEGNSTDFCVFHCTYMLDSIDLKKSVPEYSDGHITGLQNLIFDETRMAGAFFFRLAVLEYDWDVYCTNDFKAKVPSELTGFEFREVWRSSDEPPLPKTAKKKRKWSDRS